MNLTPSMVPATPREVTMAEFTATLLDHYGRAGLDGHDFIAPIYEILCDGIPSYLLSTHNPASRAAVNALLPKGMKLPRGLKASYAMVKAGPLLRVTDAASHGFAPLSGGFFPENTVSTRVGCEWMSLDGKRKVIGVTRARRTSGPLPGTPMVVVQTDDRSTTASYTLTDLDATKKAEEKAYYAAPSIDRFLANIPRLGQRASARIALSQTVVWGDPVALWKGVENVSREGWRLTSRGFEGPVNAEGKVPLLKPGAVSPYLFDYASFLAGGPVPWVRPRA